MLTARILACRTSFGRLAAVLIVAVVLGPSGDTPTGGGRTGPYRVSPW